MTAPVTATPAPAGTRRDSAPEPEQLLQLFTALQGGEEEVPVAAPQTPAPEPETETPSGDQPEDAETEGADAPPTEDVPVAPDLETVVVDGEEVRVTKDELKAGYSRTADYTRKTMKLAEDRTKHEAEFIATREARERFVSKLRDVEQFLTLGTEEPDWTKLAEDLPPAEFNKARAQWDTRQRRIMALRQERDALEFQASQERTQAQQAHITSEQQRLYAALPNWKDQEKAATEQREIVAYALKAGADYGVTPESLNQVTDAFPILVLRKAMLYDRLMSAKPKIVAQQTPAPTAKPGAKTVKVTPSRKQEAFDMLSRTGDPKAAEAYILERLTETMTR